MVRDCQEIKRRLQPDLCPVIGMYYRFTLCEAVSRIRVRGLVAQQVGIIGQAAVQVGIAPEKFVGIILCVNRCQDYDY